MQGGSLAPNEKAEIHLWDMVELDLINKKTNKGYDYQYRFERLLKLLYETKAILPIEYEIVYSLEEAFKHKKKISKRKLEGTVLKHPYGMWKDHTSRHQVKIKDDFECELRVISLLPGTGKNEDTFGSFLCCIEVANAFLTLNFAN